MKRTAKDEAAKLFEEFVIRSPVVNKDAGNKKERKQGQAQSNDPDTLTADLHGLNLDEAVRKTDQVLGQAQKNGICRVRIITGIGRHSPGLYSPLYEGIDDHLRDLVGRTGFSFTKKDGVFTVCIK
jgi:DNA-nicking Smr family endonuclease